MSAEADFHANDRDGDKVENFWVKDVAGLHGLEAGGENIGLIDKKPAKADRTSGRGRYPSLKEEPPTCGYFFGALKGYRENGKAVVYDDGNGRNTSRFGFVAWPEKYPRTGRLTYIVSEKNAVFWKDTGGKLVEEYPEEPMREGWKPAD